MSTYEMALAKLRLAYNDGDVDRFNELLADSCEVYGESIIEEIFKPII